MISILAPPLKLKNSIHTPVKTRYSENEKQ